MDIVYDMDIVGDDSQLVSFMATEVLNAMEDGKLSQDEIKEIVEKANKKEQI